MWFVIYIYALLFTWKSKKQKKRILEVASPSACAVALGKEGFFLKKTNFFAECLSCGTRQRVFKKNQKSFPSVALGEENQKKNNVGRRPTASSLPRVPARHSAKPSPSARFLTLGEGDFSVRGLAGGSSPSVALGEGFPECNWAFPESNRHSGNPAVPVVRLRLLWLATGTYLLPRCLNYVHDDA